MRLLVSISFLLAIVYLFIYPGLLDLGNFSAFRMMIYQAFWGVFFQGQTIFGPFNTSYTGVLWTMTVEFIGSFIVFAFASLFGKLRNRWLFCLAIITTPVLLLCSHLVYKYVDLNGMASAK